MRILTAQGTSPQRKHRARWEPFRTEHVNLSCAQFCVAACCQRCMYHRIRRGDHRRPIDRRQIQPLNPRQPMRWCPHIFVTALILHFERPKLHTPPRGEGGLRSLSDCDLEYVVSQSDRRFGPGRGAIAGIYPSAREAANLGACNHHDGQRGRRARTCMLKLFCTRRGQTASESQNTAEVLQTKK